MMDRMSLFWWMATAIGIGIGVGLLCGLPFLLLAILIGLRETHRVWPYEFLEEAEVPRPTDYSRQMERMAEEQGFESLGCARHTGGKLYRLRHTFWISPDLEILASTRAGTVAGIRHQVTVLISRLVDDRVLSTVDHLAGISHDPTGRVSACLLLNADFPELLARHRARLLAEMTPARPFSAEDPLADLRAIRMEQVERSVEMGRARYLDDERMSYRLTPAAVLSQVLRGYAKHWGVLLPNYARRRLARPGQMGYLASDRGPARKVLRYAELACWAGFWGFLMLSMLRPAVTREQSQFRLALFAGSFVGLGAVRLLRWWLSWRRGGVAGPRTADLMGKVALYAVMLAAGIGAVRWQMDQQRARWAAAVARAQAMRPKVVTTDVTLAELERATRGFQRFEYVGSDDKSHRFIAYDRIPPRTIRILQLGRTEWQPDRPIDFEEDESIPVGFRDGKLTCLEPEGPGVAEPDAGAVAPH